VSRDSGNSARRRRLDATFVGRCIAVYLAAAMQLVYDANHRVNYRVFHYVARSARESRPNAEAFSQNERMVGPLFVFCIC
jgi:hypothetical protein